ncbi:hypothetical protein [Brevibacillus sp. LEMMJ03]|uniref:hypothetical protein n=1 Tax=Brevibacillus sp. LEMMJ03 TaxID=2595056 RepID=UPI00163D9AEF|nr:hypothetical protein [Brevibacillus sp. LEMMJ03]
MVAVPETSVKIDWKRSLIDQLQSVREAAVLVIGEERLGGALLMAQAAEDVHQAGHLAVSIDLTGRMSHSFYGLKAMLLALEPVLRQEAADLLMAHAAEWTSLFPHARDDELFAGTVRLEEIALSASERRLSRENEQVFRLITGSVSLVLQAMERCPSLAGKTLWLFINSLDEADRLSAHAFHNLLLRRHPHIRVVATMRSVPQPVPKVQEGNPLQVLFDVRRIRAQFLSDLVGDVQPRILELQAWTEDQVRAFVEVKRPDLVERFPLIYKQSGGMPMLVQALLAGAGEGLGTFEWTAEEQSFLRLYRAVRAKEHVWSAAGVQAMTRDRLLLAEQMDASEAPGEEEVQAAHRLLYQRLTARGCPPSWTAEEYHSHLAYHAFLAGLMADGFAHVERAVEISEYWGNYENVLALVKLALRAEESFTVEQRVYLWKRCGLMQAYLGNYDEVNAAYEQALRVADTPTMRAQLYAFLTLVATKRQFNVERAEILAHQGLREIEGLEDEAAMIERGWLHNTLALTRFMQKRYKEAYELCKTAFQFLKSQSNSEALHLKINLVSNMSVVAEQMGNMDMALKIWRRFEQFLRGSGSRLFAKIYFYREAALLLCMGDEEAALTQLVRAYEEAGAITDHFHMDVIARNISSLYQERGIVDACIDWLQKSERHALEVGSYNRAEGARIAAAAIAYETGRGGEQTVEILKQLEDTCRVERRRELCRQLILEWEQGGHDVTQAVIRQELQRPRTKLGMPFYLIHIPYGHVIKE